MVIAVEIQFSQPRTKLGTCYGATRAAGALRLEHLQLPYPVGVYLVNPSNGVM